jgi:phage-related protein
MQRMEERPQTTPLTKSAKILDGLTKGMMLPFKTMSVLGKVGGATLKPLAWGVSKLTGVPTAKLKAGGAMFAKAAMPMMGGFALGILLDIVMQLLDALNPFKPLLEALTTIFGVYGAVLSQAFIPLIEKLFEVMLSDETMALFEMLTQVIMELVIAFLPVIQMLMPIFTALMMGVIIYVQWFAEKIAFLGPIFQLVGNLFQWFNDSVLWPLFELWQTYIQPIFEAIGGFFTGIATGIIGLFGGNGTFMENLTNLGTSIRNGFRSIINSVIDLINLVLPDKYKMSHLPMLANGGLAYGPTVAMVGDNPNARNDPEVIAPLSKLQGMGGGGVQITINGNITEEKLFQMRKDLLIQNIY